MTYLTNGAAAELLLKFTLSELGFRKEFQLTSEQMLGLLPCSVHVDRGIRWMYEKGYWDESPSEASASVLADYCLGVDALLEGNNGEIISVDVTVTDDKVGHKMDVHRQSRAAKRKLNIHRHVILVLETNETWSSLTDDQKWLLVDTVLEEGSKGSCEVKYLTI